MFVEEHLQKSLTSTQNENLKIIVNKQKCKITSRLDEDSFNNFSILNEKE